MFVLTESVMRLSQVDLEKEVLNLKGIFTWLNKNKIKYIWFFKGSMQLSVVEAAFSTTPAEWQTF